MKSYIPKLKVFSLAAVLLIGFYGCSAGGNHTGQLSLSLIDKDSHEFTEVWVTIKDIYVHMESDPEDSWTKILDVNKTINLKTLAGGVREELGIVELTPGHYTQMRLMIGTMNTIDQALPGNYVLDTKEGPVELKIPSGVQSGVKLVQGFDINESDTTRLIFDFDVAASIVATGNSGKYILRPTIHQIDDSQTRTNIKGTVKNATDVAIAGAAVDLQVYKPRVDGQDYKDEISTYGSTTTNSLGEYLYWFLNIPEPQTLNVVATNWDTTDGKTYVPAWDQIVDAMNGHAYERNFKLNTATEIGTLKLTAVVPDLDTDKVPVNTLFVTISIRQKTALEGTPMVEVMKKVIAGYDDDWAPADIKTVSVDLPVGDYTIVASIDGKKSLEEVKTLTAAGLAIDFKFQTP